MAGGIFGGIGGAQGDALLGRPYKSLGLCDAYLAGTVRSDDGSRSIGVKLGEQVSVSSSYGFSIPVKVYGVPVRVGPTAGVVTKEGRFVSADLGVQASAGIPKNGYLDASAKATLKGYVEQLADGSAVLGLKGSIGADIGAGRAVPYNWQMGGAGAQCAVKVVLVHLHSTEFSRMPLDEAYLNGGPENLMNMAVIVGDYGAASYYAGLIPGVYNDNILRVSKQNSSGAKSSSDDEVGPAIRQIGIDAAIERAAAQKAAAEAATRAKYDYTLSQDSSDTRPPSPAKGSPGAAGGPVPESYADKVASGTVGGGSSNKPMTGGMGSPVTSGLGGTTTGGKTTTSTGNFGGGGKDSGQAANGKDSHAGRAGFPIILDLNGNGIEIRERDGSTTFVDSDGDGLLHNTAWAGVGDGVLFFDAGNDGLIKESREYVFTEWDPTAKDDMAALRSKFDTNGDGKLTSADAAWANFKVMVTNTDGSQTAQTLAQLGITEINLLTNTVQQSFEDGSAITGQTTFVMGGVTKTAAAVTLVADVSKDQSCDGYFPAIMREIAYTRSSSGERMSRSDQDGIGHG